MGANLWRLEAFRRLMGEDQANPNAYYEDLEGTEILDAAEKFSETVDLDIAKELRPSQGLAETMKQMVVENKYASALGLKVEKSPDDEESGTRTLPSAASTSAFFTVPRDNAG